MTAMMATRITTDDMSTRRYRYRLRPSVRKEKYGAVDESNFGSVTVSVPEGGSYVVRDLQYRLDDGRLGMRFVPVNDDGPIQRLDGSEVPGSSLVDNLLRARMGLQESDPIYAIAAYIRPEEHSVTLGQLPTTKKIFHGYRHLAAYIGDGKTTHSPEKHHSEAWRLRGHNVWRVAGYPASVFFISLDGVDQLTLNRNARIVDAILNSGALAPASFERMRCRVFTLNTALQFYRDWIREAEYLTDLSWHMSCGDHKAVVINVMLNVPHNPHAFREIFADDGSRLWSDFLRRFRQVCGNEFRPADETHFQPLWQKADLDVHQLRPLSVSQQNAFDAAMVENRLDKFTGPRPLPPGVGMAWPMETVADLLYDFAYTYLRFADTGGVVSSIVLARLATQAPGRLGISEARFCDLVTPLISKLLLADAVVNAPHDTHWLTKARHTFSQSLLDAAAEPENNFWSSARVEKLINRCFGEVKGALPKLINAKAASTGEALEWLQPRLRQIMDDLRSKAGSGLLATHFFASPSVFHRIALGTYPCSRFVKITPVCTVVDHTELEPEDTDSSPVSTSELRDGHRRRPIEHQRSLTRRSRDAKSGSSLFGDAVRPRRCSLCDGERQLVFAVGELGYDFGCEANFDTFKQRMSNLDEIGRNPLDEKQLLNFLNDQPSYAASLLWTLKQSGTPYYILQPEGPFAQNGYRLLIRFLADQCHAGAERVAVPGTIRGQARLLNGQSTPVINPDLRGLRNWTRQALTDSAKQIPAVSQDLGQLTVVMRDLLDRVYYELRNEGRSPRDRALNYAGTNLLEYRLIPADLGMNKSLDKIGVEKCPICRPRSDCWDITLAFFDPDQPMRTVRQIYQYTVDVSQVIPVRVGELRSWTARVEHG